MNRKFELATINKSRKILIGLATLLIVFFHTYINYSNLTNNEIISKTIIFLRYRSNCGVDIFLFLSGIGLYFSLSKNNLLTFYKHRFIRIIPAYIIVVLAYYIFTKNITSSQIIELFSLTSFFIKGDRLFWFIQFIFILYLIYPLIVKIINKRDWYLILILGLTLIFNFTIKFALPTTYSYLEIAITRIPVFILGTFFGKKITNNTTISNNILLISFFLPIIILIIIYLFLNFSYLNDYQRYLYCPLAISIVINISYICTIKKQHLISKFLIFLGNYSLEVYLLYEIISLKLLTYFNELSIILVYFLSFCLTIIISILLKNIVNYLLNFLTTIYTKIKLRNQSFKKNVIIN